MSRLNKLQIYAIRWLHSQNKTADFIADDLGLTSKQVSNAIEKFGTSTANNTIKTAKISSKDLMINETSMKKTKNISVMTKEASMYNDAAAKKNPPNVVDNSHYIYRQKR